MCEFGKLHQLLADEEKLLLQKLEEEESQILVMISENLARVTEQKCLLVELIREIKEKMQQPVEELLKVRLCHQPSQLSPASAPGLCCVARWWGQSGVTYPEWLFSSRT